MDTTIAYHKPLLETNLHNLLILNIVSILKNGDIVNGSYVSQLEQYFIETCKVKYAVACASCTTGLIASVEAIQKLFDIEKIAIPLFTWYSTWYAVMKNDTVGIPYDINKYTWLMQLTESDLKDVDSAIFVDIFGNMAPKLNTNKPIIYDAAHGYGLSELGQRGIVEVVSFSHTKLVTAMQGGIILTNHDRVYKYIKDSVTKYFKMEEINALICLESIKQYKETQYIRKQIMFAYSDKIKHNITTQLYTESNNSVFGVLFETMELRDKIRDNLARHGVETKVYYVPVFKAPGFSTTYDIYNRILCLPVYPQMVDKVEYICQLINEV